MRPASLLLAVLGPAVLVGAGLLVWQSGGERENPSRGATQHVPDPGTRAADPSRARARPDLPDEPPLVAPSAPAKEPVLESTPPVASEPGARSEAALLFRVLDARTSEPVSAFEARLGQDFLRPLLDEKGRIRHDFPDGRARFPGVIEGFEGRNVQLAVLARGYGELRVPDLYVAPGRELDLGTLRLERVPRLTVRVLDGRTGEAVPGAFVTLLRAGIALAPEAQPPASADLDPWSGRTDPQGRVLLTSRPGEIVTLAVRHATHAPLDLELTLPLGEEHEETVRLPAR